MTSQFQWKGWRSLPVVVALLLSVWSQVFPCGVSGVTCPETFFPYPEGETCFRYDSVGVGWPYAMYLCGLSSATLAKIPDLETERFLMTQLAGENISTFWIGLGDWVVEGTPQWLDGDTNVPRSVVYSSSNDSDDCVVFQLDGIEISWLMNYCSGNIPDGYLCQTDPIPEPTTLPSLPSTQPPLPTLPLEPPLQPETTLQPLEPTLPLEPPLQPETTLQPLEPTLPLEPPLQPETTLQPLEPTLPLEPPLQPETTLQPLEPPLPPQPPLQPETTLQPLEPPLQPQTTLQPETTLQPLKPLLPPQPPLQPQTTLPQEIQPQMTTPLPPLPPSPALTQAEKQEFTSTLKFLVNTILSPLPPSPSSTNSTNPTPKAPDKLCPCACLAFKFNSTPSPKALASMLNKIQQALNVNTQSLSTTRNKKISAKDPRPSSKSIAIIAILLASFPVFAVVTLDLLSVYRNFNDGRSRVCSCSPS